MEIEQEASLQGWVPKEQFKGDESKWVDAETYVDRGKQIMPIIQSNNKRLLTEIDALKNTVGNLQNSLVSSQESMEALKVFHQESTKAQVEKARREILANLKEAKSEGDVDQEIQYTADLSKFDAAQIAAEQVKPAPRVEPKQAQLHPDTEAWMSENSWYSSDPVKAGIMDGVAKKLRAENSPLQGKAFLDAAGGIAARMFAQLDGDSDGETTSKVEGSRHSSSSGSGSSAAKGYSSLPADAKEVCQKQASKFVGENKAYKTTKDWQEFFAAEYHKGA